MGGEGTGDHWYEGSEILVHFVNGVSKVHDWFNCPDYNPINGKYMSRGSAFDSAFQVYSFVGMPVAAGMYVIGYGGYEMSAGDRASVYGLYNVISR